MSPSALAFFVIGIALVVFAKRISTLKSSAWQRFYHAASANPLSKHAGTETSIKTGATMWRLIGILLIINGLLRLLPANP
jgi:hypothetical protein